MNALDLLGVVGVLLILVAYAGAQLGRLPPDRAPALSMNLAGAALVLASLTQKFNLSAVLMEGSWALVAAYGLLRLAVKRRTHPAAD